MDYNRSINDLYRGEERSDVLSFNSFFNQVYGWMCGGLLLTGGIAYWLSLNPKMVMSLMKSPIAFWGIIIAQFILVIGISAAIQRISAAAATLGFAVYAALNGVIFSTLFLIYTGESIALTFGVTGVTFGATSFFGYVTKRDLSGMGGFLTMALIGFVIGSLVNIFWHNSTFYWLMTYAGILLFAGLTAYDTNKLKQIAMNSGAAGGESLRKIALLGALTLYLDFINMFLLLLRIFGRGRD